MIILKYVTCYPKQYFNGVHPERLGLKFIKITKKSFKQKILKNFENSLLTYEKSQKNAVSTKILNNQPETKVRKSKFEYICHSINNLSFKNKNPDFCSSIPLTLFELPELLIILNKFLQRFSAKEINARNAFYDNILLTMFEKFNSSFAEHYVVQLIYFISLTDDDHSDILRHVEQLLPHMLSLSLFEQAVVCTSFYRSNCKIECSKAIEINQSLEKHAFDFINNQVLLVSVCKILRTSDLNTNLNLENFNKVFIESNVELNPTAMSHLAGLYAIAKLAEPNFIKKIINDFTKIIRKKIPIRLKDIDRFLWSISVLNISVPDSMKVILHEHLLERFIELKHKDGVGHLLNILLSLHMLKCWNHELLKHCINERIFQKLKKSDIHFKIKQRQNLLLQQIKHEMKIVIPVETKINSMMESSKDLEIINYIGKHLVEQGIIKKAIMEYPIPGLFIPGVTLLTDLEKYHVDIMNKKTCLKNTNIPDGLMNLKIRLLSALNYHHIRLSADVFKEDSFQTQSEILQIITNSIDSKKLNIKYQNAS